MIHFKVWAPGYYQVICRAITACGTSTIENYYNASQGYFLTFYPNLANDKLSVSYKSEMANSSEGKSSTQERRFSAKLIDQKGKVLDFSNKGNLDTPIIFNTLNIPDGTYFLHVNDGRNTVKKQIVIKH